MHVLSERATNAYEEARATVQKFLHATYVEEIIFTKSCTESINLVAHGFINPADHIVLSILEHHSNIVPWMQQHAHLHWIDIDDGGNVKLEDLDRFLTNGKIQLVAITGQSNVLGVNPPLKEIIERSHAAGARVLVDAAQLIAHHPIDVQDLDCDFLAFSGHKLYGPMGIGVLYAKRSLLEAMPPFLGGGMMIREVQKDHFTPADIPAKFEAGTPPVAEAAGLKAAIDWCSLVPWSDIEQHERNLIEHIVNTLRGIDGITILGKARSGCVSFTLDSIHPHDLTEILGRKGICLRAGHHCTMPLHKRLGITASTRVSVGIYNTMEEIERIPEAIEAARKLLRGNPSTSYKLTLE